MNEPEPEPIMVDGYTVTIEQRSWGKPGRYLSILADYEDSISVHEDHWPALIEALRQVGVITTEHHAD